MKMVRLSGFALVVVCFSASVLAQSPPQIVNTQFDFDTLENARVSILVSLSDPDPNETLTLTFSLSNGAALGILESQLQFNFKSKSFNYANINVANQFSVPAGILGGTIEIRLDVRDKDNLTASRIFRYQVVGVNQPPELSLEVTGPGVKTTGTESNPFRYGSIQLHLTINDDRGVDSKLYQAWFLSGSFCIPEYSAFRWFGREGLSPTVDVAPVATKMSIELSATVTDGVFVETVKKTIWVEPEPEGCDIAGHGTNPLDSVTATASPNPVSKGSIICLTGGITGDTSPYMAVWYLGEGTSGYQLIANAWEAEYRATGSSENLNFEFRVSEIAGTGEAGKRLYVEVISPGGGSGKVSPLADVGTIECREVQLQTQHEVWCGGPYEKHTELVKAASDVVDIYRKSGEISNKCSSCIMQPFQKSIPIEDQEACGWLCPCLRLSDWASLLETDEWTECVISDPYWDVLVALTSDSHILWSGFQNDSPAEPGFNACVSFDLVEYQFLELLAPITEYDRNECLGVILDKADKLGLICE